MAGPPRKRRKLSSDADSVIEESNEEVTVNIADPTTPTRRASYLSPTKASLARSHPDILAKSPKRGSLTEPRGRSLRQKLLGSRASTDDAASTPKTAPRQGQKTRTNQLQDEIVMDREKTGFADAIAHLRQPAAEEQTIAKRPDQQTRSPLEIRQPPNSTAGKRPQNSKTETTSSNSLPVPRLVRRQEAPLRQQSEARNEPDLPPTPVQLGLGTAPDRPKGLPSSSSIGSKSGSGSGRHRRRVREGGKAVTSSPLKPKNPRPVSPTDFSDVDEAEIELVEEALESDNEGRGTREINDSDDVVENQHQAQSTNNLKEKQSELTALRAELEGLTEDLTKLESLTDRLQQDADLSLDASMAALLLPKSPSTFSSLQSPDSHPSFTKDPSAYLKLFATGNLHLDHRTSTTRVLKRTKTTHTLTVTAPSPWLPQSFFLSFAVRVDVEDAQVDHVIPQPSTNSWQYGNLHTWIGHRLRSPLHRLDIGGILWGAGKYFEACTARASILKSIDETYNKKSSTSAVGEGILTTQEAISLQRYLHETQIEVIHTNQEHKSLQISDRASLKRIMVSYDIELTWTGEAVTSIDIALTGINAQTQKGAKELFKKLLALEGAVGAFDGVWNLLGFDREEVVVGAAVAAPTKRPTTAKTRKRIAAN